MAKVKKNLSLFEKGKRKGELKEEYQKVLEELTEIKEGEKIEKYLKNEAYAFLLAEGLLDKFLEFRERFHRTKAQDALYSLVAEADMGGLWIDLYA